MLDIALLGTGGMVPLPEQAVLAKKGIPLYYYDKKTRTELDFLWNDGGSLSVIEVKSGSEYRRHIALYNAIEDNPKVFKRKIIFI